MSVSSKYKYYVYELSSSIDGKVFYVGKGCGDRMFAHEKEAAKEACSKKANKIRSIWSKKGSVVKTKVALFCDEQEAYDYETDVIAFYGLDNLTNIMPGGQVAFERRVRESAERRNAAELERWLKSKSSETMYRAFAQWFGLGFHDGGKELVVNADKTSGIFINLKIHEFVFNKLLPKMFCEIKKSKQLFSVFESRMKNYGVTFA